MMPAMEITIAKQQQIASKINNLAIVFMSSQSRLPESKTSEWRKKSLGMFEKNNYFFNYNTIDTKKLHLRFIFYKHGNVELSRKHFLTQKLFLFKATGNMVW